MNGVTFHVDARTRLRFASAYDAGAAAALQDRIGPGSEVWNIGANVGVYVLQLSSLVGPTGHVVAFEPNPYAAGLLWRNVCLNGFQERVTLVRAAVGQDEGEVELYVAGSDPMARPGRPNPLLLDTQTLRVPLVTIDGFWRQRGRTPDGVVMDIEGWEIAALASAREMLSSAAGSIVIVIELHPDAWAWSGHDRHQLEALMAALALEAVPLSGQHDPLGEYGQVLLRYRRGA